MICREWLKAENCCGIVLASRGRRFSAQAALEKGVIDIMAGDLGALLLSLNGWVVEIAGRAHTLHTAHARIELVEPTVVTRVLAILSNPNIAFLLLMVGAYGLIFEIAKPH